MEVKKPWAKTATWVAVVAGIISLLLWAPGADAKSKRKSSKRLPAAAAAVARAPVCESQLHPKITKVTPDPVKPGQKITIKGKNFGSKACFQKLAFGQRKSRSFKYVNKTTLTATVPRLKPGLTKVNIMTAGGASDYIVLVEKGKGAKKVKRSKKSKRSKKGKRSKRSRRSKR